MITTHGKKKWGKWNCGKKNKIDQNSDASHKFKNTDDALKLYSQTVEKEPNFSRLLYSFIRSKKWRSYIYRINSSWISLYFFKIHIIKYKWQKEERWKYIPLVPHPDDYEDVDR